MPWPRRRASSACCSSPAYRWNTDFTRDDPSFETFRAFAAPPVKCPFCDSDKHFAVDCVFFDKARDNNDDSRRVPVADQNPLWRIGTTHYVTRMPIVYWTMGDGNCMLYSIIYAFMLLKFAGMKEVIAGGDQAMRQQAWMIRRDMMRWIVDHQAVALDGGSLTVADKIEQAFDMTVSDFVAKFGVDRVYLGHTAYAVRVLVARASATAAPQALLHVGQVQRQL